MLSAHSPCRAAAPGGHGRRGRRPYIATFLLALISFLPAHSQTTRNPDLDRIRGEITKLRSRLEQLHEKAQSAERELEAVDIELGIRTRELEVAMRLQADLEQQQRAIEQQIAGLAPQIVQQKRFLSRRLSALYRLGGLSYVRLLLSIDDNRDPIEAMSMLTYLVSRDARAITRFEVTRKQLQQRFTELADRRRRITEMKRVVEQRREDVATAYREKARMLASLQQQGSQSERRIADLEEKARRLERLIDVLSQQKHGMAPPTDIASVQGALSWPVSGKVIESFGRHRDPKFATVTASNGLKIAAPAGAQVNVIYPGTVLFSQWFKGYGNLIIVDHGNGVVSLYGNLKGPTVAPGDRVIAGQPIAGVGESEEAQLGYLYFEIRQNNKPQDPQKWLR